MSARVRERLYRALLRAYPAEFRRAYEDDLVGDFHRDLAHPRYRGLSGRVRFWGHTLTDWARTVWSERRSNRRTPAPDRRPDGTTSSRRRGTLAAALPVRQAVRGLMRDRAFSVVALLTLAVGMGATTVVFALVHGLLLTPLPLPEPERLVQVEERERDTPGARMAAYGNWLDLAESDAFEELAAFAYDTKTLTGGVDAAQRLRSREVSANFFAALGVTPALGRVFDAEEMVEGQHRVVVLSHALWNGALGADPDILGRTLQLDATAYTVIGVMPPGFDFPFLSDIWVPLVPPQNPEGLRRQHRYRMTGRLARGVDLRQAQESLDVIAARLERAFPDTNQGDYFAAYPLLDEYVGDARPALNLLSAAVGLVLLIACLNIAGLSLARSSARRREIAMRRALGASRSQLAGLVLSEGLALGVGGGLLGLPLAAGALRGLLTLAGEDIPRADNASMTALVYLFAATASLVSALLVSFLPLLREAVTDAAALVTDRALGQGGRLLGRRVLVIGEVALAVVLVAAAALLGRSLLNLTSVPTGVVPEGVLTMDLTLPNGKYPERADTARFFGRLLPRIESLPGIERAAVTLIVPANPFGWRNSLTIRDRPVAENELPLASYVVVSPGYFETMGIPLRAGRPLRWSDEEDGSRVAVINRTAAERFWPDESPLGALILGDREDDGSWFRVVGVVEDVRQSLYEPPLPEVYVPLSQDRVLSFVLVARARGAPEQHASAVRAAIMDADADVPVTGVMSLDDRIGQRTADAHLRTTLMSVFAGLALTLAAVGVYGVLSYSVSLRRREFGLRTAIGATRGRVLRLVLREALTIGCVAVAAGIAGALALGRALAGMLFQVDASDPLTLTAVGLAIAAVTVAAALAPAWRAASADPLTVLRSE